MLFLGKVHLPCWCFIVVRHGGNAHRGVCCFLPLRRVADDIYPLFHKHVFQGLAGWNPEFTYDRPSETFFLFPGAQVLVWHQYHHVLASSWTRQSRPLPFFPSWMYLLDGDDNCMFSVPFSTSDLHYSCWQSGENCQVVSAGAFTLLCYACWFSSKGGCSPYFSVLLSCPRVVCSMFPSFRPDTVASGIPGHAGGWHLRGKPCVVLLLFLLV